MKTMFLYLQEGGGYKNGLIQFLDEVLTDHDDVWVVTNSQLLEWINSPVPVEDLVTSDIFACK